MDASTAIGPTHALVADVIGNLTPDQRDLPTPCRKWTVHELVEHVVGGGHMAAALLSGDTPSTEGGGDLLAGGPAAGWASASSAFTGAVTPESLAASYPFFSFGDMPGEVIASVFVVDHLIHAWDLAAATGQSISVDDELAGWALEALKMVAPPDGRDGDMFAEVVAVDDSAPMIDRLVGYSGRTP